MSRINLLLIAFFALIHAPGAFAFTPNPPDNPYTFSGETRLTTNIGSYVCDLSITGNFSEIPNDPNRGTFIATAAIFSGAFPCMLIEAKNLPWGNVGNILPKINNIEISFDNPGLSIDLFSLSCGGSTAFEFLNDSTASHMNLDGAAIGSCSFSSAPGNPAQNLIFTDPAHNILIP